MLIPVRQKAMITWFVLYPHLRLKFCTELNMLKSKLTLAECCLQWFRHAYVSDIILIIYIILPWNAQYGVSMSYIQRI